MGNSCASGQDVAFNNTTTNNDNNHNNDTHSSVINAAIGERRDEPPTVSIPVSGQDDHFSIVDAQLDQDLGNGELLAESRMENYPRQSNYDRSWGFKALSNQGEKARGCIYGGVPGTLGGRILAMIAGRAGMKLVEVSAESTDDVHLTLEEGLDVVAGLSSRDRIDGFIYNVCGQHIVSPYQPHDPSTIESFAANMSKGFTLDWRRRSTLARTVLGFEPGSRECLPSSAEGSLWSLLLASGEALGGLYPDLCVIALMDCTELNFVEEGVSPPTTGLLPLGFLLATLSALTTKAGGRRVVLTTRCYCSALIQRYACASLAPTHLDFGYVEGETSLLDAGGSGNLFWKVAGFIFRMPASWTFLSPEIHSLGPVCDIRKTLPELSRTIDTSIWRHRPFRVGAVDNVPKLMDLARLRELVRKVASAEVAIFGDGARVLFDAILPPNPDVLPTNPPIPSRTSPPAGLRCPYLPRTLARKLGEGAGLAGWDASQRATWIVLNWDVLATDPWTSAGLEAMSFLMRFGTSCPLQVEYARFFGHEAVGGVRDVLASLDPEPWSVILDDKETAGLRGLICLVVDAERSQDVWTGQRVQKGKCYGPVASTTSCGTFTSLDPRGSPIVYGLRVLQGSDPASVDYGQGVSGFTYHSRLGKTSWSINVEPTTGFGRTLHIRHHPSALGDIVPCQARDWNHRTNGLIGSAASL